MKAWVGKKLKDTMKSKHGVKARRWLGIGPAIAANHEIDQIPVEADVVVYFSDLPNKAYQLEQWLPTLEKLHESHRVILVFRKVPALRHFRRLTKIPKIFVRRLEDLVKLYEENDFKLCLYVNNGVANFQSLSAPRPVHVHINHGESDKLSMVSNQAKAYDKIFVAGPAAIDRHKAVLLDFDMGKLIAVGRPQLDSHFLSVLPPFPGQTIMYAPTWEGENEANNYTSMDVIGDRIIQRLTCLPDTRVVYKPHPRILTSTTTAVAQAHERILEILNESNNLGSRHLVAEPQDILTLFQDVDVLVTDISSVGLDFLYLHPDKPLILTDRRDDLDRINREAPISRACQVLSESTADVMLGEFPSLIESTSNGGRRQMRSYYFGELDKGASTAAFISTINTLITDRTHQLGPPNLATSLPTPGNPIRGLVRLQTFVRPESV